MCVCIYTRTSTSELALITCWTEWWRWYTHSHQTPCAYCMHAEWALRTLGSDDVGTHSKRRTRTYHPNNNNNKIYILSEETIQYACTHAQTRTHTYINIHYKQFTTRRLKNPDNKLGFGAEEDINAERNHGRPTVGKIHFWRLDINESRDGFLRRGGSFHNTQGPKTEEAQEPTVESLVRGIWMRFWISEAERRVWELECVKPKIVTEIRQRRAYDTFIAENVYRVLNFLWDCESVERFKQRRGMASHISDTILDKIKLFIY